MADNQVVAIVKALDQFAERIVTKITLDITANLIEQTPIDTGWARANWVPSIGQDRIVSLQNIVNPSPTDVAGAKASQSEGIASVATGFKLADKAVFISNNVPYIVRLNEGSSKQAPAGFVTSAIQKAVTKDIRNIG